MSKADYLPSVWDLSVFSDGDVSRSYGELLPVVSLEASPSDSFPVPDVMTLHYNSFDGDYITKGVF